MIRVGVSKVLIIDDNALYGRVLKEGFNKYNIESLVIDDLADPVQMAVEFQPDFVILDIMMPNKTGFDICQQIKTDPRTLHIPIIFVSANEDADSVITSMHFGCIDYIKKPVDVEDLVKALITHNFHMPLKECFSSFRETINNLKDKYNAHA